MTATFFKKLIFGYTTNANERNDNMLAVLQIASPDSLLGSQESKMPPRDDSYDL